MLSLSFGAYIYIGYANRVRDTKGFYVAGQGVPAIANGAATAADWMSAASFISMAGLISFMGYDGSVYLMGWTGGYVLLALLLAPYLRKFNKYTRARLRGRPLLLQNRPERGCGRRRVCVIHLRGWPDAWRGYRL